MKHSSVPFCKSKSDICVLFGTFLVRFLNADLSTYESAYKDFFFAYGFEILRDLEEDGNLEDYTYTQRYAVYLITHKGNLYTYAKNDHIIRDSYSNKNRELTGMSEQNLLESLKNKSMLISMQYTHQSYDLSSICYAILEELSKTTNNPIKKCQNCGMYFIPNSRLDEVYCDYPKRNKKTCREQGAMLSYQNRLKEKSAYGEYRKLYQQKFGIVNKNKNNKKLKKDFEN